MSDIFEFSDRAVEQIADVDPMTATELGVPGRDHLWPDLTVVGRGAQRAVWAQLLAEANAVNVVGHNDVVAQRVLIEAATEAITAHDNGDHFRDLNSIASTFQGLKGIFDVMARETESEWQNIIVRLETIAAPLNEYRETLSEGLTAGMAVAHRQVVATIEEARVVEGPDSSFVTLRDDFDGSGIMNEMLSKRLNAATEGARREFGRFADWLEADYLPVAPAKDACGRQRYEAEARKHLGMAIDIEATYEWGWAEVERLTTRIVEVCTVIDPESSIHEVVEMLATDPERGAATVDEYIATMQAVQDRAVEQVAGTHFEVPEQIRHVDVKVSPPGGALAPYYTGPSEDFSRPGTVWYPIGSRKFFPLWDEMSTAYHEGFPGHHLQVGVQIAMGDELSRFHRIAVWSPGSGEGWALYAEHLMGELGFHDKAEYELGMLTAQLHRACRVVIDIGSHCELPIPDHAHFHPGATWTWDLAVEMIRDVALQPDEMSRSEATRYLGWPGQAISYKVSEQVILDLRDELSQRDGFDLKEFHSRVLSVGSVGLDLLKELVRAA